MNYLVTGAAGFVGAHLCSSLTLQGHNVTAIDNFSDYYSPKLKEARVSELLSPLGIMVRNIDLANITKISPIFSEFDFDIVIHLAAQPGVRTPLSESWKYIRDNLTAFTNVLQLAVQTQVPSFVYASSSSVYGNLKAEKFKEIDTSLNPISIYGATKLSNEILANAYVRESATKIRGMRFFTVYGPWGRPDMAYFRLLAAAVNGGRFELFGDGNVKRDFTFISDIVKKIIDLSLDLNQRDAGYSDIVNIGGGKPQSIKDLISIVNSELGTDIELLQRPHHFADTKFTCADTTLLSSITQTHEFVSLRSGMGETIRWAKKLGVAENLSDWVKTSY